MFYSLQVGTEHMGDARENPAALRVWLGLAVYAAIGLFGLFVFHDAARPFTG